ncbi:hypothetical protein BST61_g10335 [Cercospora zeina]
MFSTLRTMIQAIVTASNCSGQPLRTHLLGLITSLHSLCVMFLRENDRLNFAIQLKALGAKLAASEDTVSQQKQKIEQLQLLLAASRKSASHQKRKISHLHAVVYEVDQTTKSQQTKLHALDTRLTSISSSLESHETTISRLRHDLATSTLETLRFSTNAAAATQQAQNYRVASESLRNSLTRVLREKAAVMEQMNRELEEEEAEINAMALRHRVEVEGLREDYERQLGVMEARHACCCAGRVGGEVARWGGGRAACGGGVGE